jgi:RecA-family ATPase
VADDKADLYDHVLAGYTIADLKPARLNRLHPVGTNLHRLLNGDYPATKWVIPNLLPVGLTMLGGAPKVGKSMIALDIALAVTHGGYALYGPKCNQGSVLYLSLDNDDESTLSARARHLSSRVGYPNDGPMEILTEYPVGRDAIAAISEWIELERDENREPLFVVADTLARIEPEYEGSINDRSLYAGATAAMARWSALADKAQIGIMFVHHSHKQGERGKGSDWMNLFMGSQGLAAGCKNLMMVQHDRGTNEAYLLTDSRHCDGQELKMQRDGWGWALFDQITSRPSVPGKAGLRVVQGGKP